MQCPYCGTPVYGGSEVCGRCGGKFGATDRNALPQAGPGWQTVEVPAQKAIPKAEEKREEALLSPPQYLLLLGVGLLPGIGIFYSLSKAFGHHTDPERRSLAKAMLWVHGVGLCLVLAGLCVWVLGLAARLA